MDRTLLFERNLLCLSRRDPALASRLLEVKTSPNRYKFLESPRGELIPALVDLSGAPRALHSPADPRREAGRLMDTLKDEGFVALLGLGGGYYAEAALERENVRAVLVIDYDMAGIAELLRRKDYTGILGDPRLRFLCDPTETAVEECLLEMYQPVLHGGIRVLSLRARTARDAGAFAKSGAAIERALKRVSADYSVQAYFGTRWFSNIIRNLRNAEKNDEALPPVKRAALIAAGPSLNLQIPRLRERREELFIIAADTSLPCLLAENINPDAVVSIDCQHISYYHFMAGLPRETLLFTDLASPPLVASQSEKVRFFSGNHPLTAYISQNWRAFPGVDTSGGNVTYASADLAEKLGARAIELYGADFSYPLGLTYARGTYLHPYFEIQQNRLASLESLHSAFLYRAPLEKKAGAKGWYYENPSLKFYRERLEEKWRASKLNLIPQEGLGAPLKVPLERGEQAPGPGLPFGSAGKTPVKAEDFLTDYREDLRALPVLSKPRQYIETLGAKERLIFATLLPAGAALKRRSPELSPGELMEKTKAYCIEEIDRVLGIT